MPLRRAVSAATLLGVAAMVGCEGRSPIQRSDPQPAADLVAPATPPPAEAELTHLLTEPTAYYLTSPAQSRPPDGSWAADTRVRVVESAGAFSRVTAPDGTTAWISSASLRTYAPDSR
jgi:hypothetical protein